MIDIPNNDQNQALSILASISRFATLPETMAMREWLTSELARLDASNRRESGETLLWQQGACQVLEKLIRLQEEADDKVQKIRTNINNRKGVQP
jgi:hypothetical protein